MRIEVSEYLSECQRTLEYCQRQREDIIDVQRALVEFQSGMRESFIGKTGTAITNYFEEVVSVLLTKVERILTDNIAAMRIMETDMLDLFEDGGVIDTDYMNYEYINSFNSFSDEVSYNLDEINKLTSSISDIMHIPRLDVDKPQEIKYDMRRAIERVTELLIDTDRRWCNLLEPIAEQMEDIKSLLATITDNEISPINYQKGTIEFLAASKGDIRKIKTLEDFDTINEYYRYVIVKGIYEGKIVEKNIDGKNYYEFNDTFYWKNYNDIMQGNLIFVDNNGILEMFIVQEDRMVVSVPFGIFEPDPFSHLFNDRQWNEIYGNDLNLVHYRTNPMLENLTNRVSELKKIAKYYSKEKNADELGKMILRYLGNLGSDGIDTEFTLYELDDIADRWSGGNSWRDFGGEIEAHADMLIGTWLTEIFAKNTYFNGNDNVNREEWATDDTYYDSAAIADMGVADSNMEMNKYFNIIWGGLREDEIDIIFNQKSITTTLKENVTFQNMIKKEILSSEEKKLLFEHLNSLKMGGLM